LDFTFKKNFTSETATYIGLEEIWYILNGRVEFYVRGNNKKSSTFSLSALESYHIQSQVQFQFRNVGQEPLHVLVLQLPLEKEICTIISKESYWMPSV